MLRPHRVQRSATGVAGSVRLARSAPRCRRRRRVVIAGTSQCTPAGGRGVVPVRAVFAQLSNVTRRSTTTSPSRAQRSEHGLGGGRRRAAGGAGEHRRVPPSLSDSERGGSCGERGIRTLGRLLTYVRLASGYLRPLGHLSKRFSEAREGENVAASGLGSSGIGG